jgi:type 1 fimbria pilin
MPSLNANIDLLLIKTSNVLPGTIQGSSLPTVTAYRDVGDASIPSLALSYSGSINIVSQTCRTPDVIVNLGTHKAFEFTGIGSFTAWTDFRINLNDCPMFHGIYNDAGAKVGNSISYRIDPIGTAVNAEQGILMINKGTGDKDVSANGVGVQVATNTGTVLPLAVIRPSEIALNTNIGSVSIPLRARYVQTSATVTPGPANASASFTIIYQ